jgi:hypothetical protein
MQAESKRSESVRGHGWSFKNVGHFTPRLTAAAILILLLFSSLGNLYAIDIDEIASVGSAHARLLESIEFKSSAGQPYDYHIFLEGDKYRSELYHVKMATGIPAGLDKSDPADLSKTRPAEIFTYDEKDYYRKATRKGKEMISHGALLSKFKLSSIATTVNTFLSPYFWLMHNEKDYGLGVISNERAWKNALKDAEYLGDEKVLDLDCIHLVNSSPNGYKRHLWLAKEYGFYPMKSVGVDKDGALSNSTEVLEYQLFDSSEPPKKILIPTSIVDKQPKFDRETNAKIKKGSLKVNQGIDDDLFTPKPSSNNVEYVDLDKQMQEIADRKNGVKPVEDLDAKGKGFWILRISLIVSGFALIGFVIFRKLARRT